MDRVFESFAEGNPTHDRFERLYPDSIGPSTMNQWLLAEVNGQIAAGIQIVPRPMVLAGVVELNASGLGNVFCHPPFRGTGLMSALLEGTLARLEAEGYAINLLGGDRLRYGRFGWENAGTARELHLRAGMLRGDGIPVPSVVDFRLWDGSTEYVLRMHEAFQRLTYRAVRTPAEHRAALQRPGPNVWICDSSDHGFGYAAIRGSSVVEYAGEPTAVEQLLRFFLKSRSLDISVPPVDRETELEATMLRFSGGFGVGAVGMVRIVSLERVLQAYLPLLSERLQGWRGSLCLAITDTEDSCMINCDGEVVSILPSVQADTTVRLEQQPMTRLLFGPFAPALEPELAAHQALRRAFPLPLYWNSLSHV
jgi:GNAT superfamily N-acetyltransferase